MTLDEAPDRYAGNRAHPYPDGPALCWRLIANRAGACILAHLMPSALIELPYRVSYQGGFTLGDRTHTTATRPTTPMVKRRLRGASAARGRSDHTTTQFRALLEAAPMRW